MYDAVVIEPPEERISFISILQGALGPHEVDAASRWLSKGTPVDDPDGRHDNKSRFVTEEPIPRCYDTRVFGIEDTGKDTNHETTALQDEQAMPPPPPKQRQQQKKRPQGKQTKNKPILENIYGREAFISHRDLKGTFTGRRARRSALNTTNMAGVSIEELFLWVKNLARKKIGNFPNPTAPENMRKILALQRARLLMYPDEGRKQRRKQRQSSGNKSIRKSKRRAVDEHNSTLLRKRVKKSLSPEIEPSSAQFIA